MPVLEEIRSKGNNLRHRPIEADARPAAPAPRTLRTHRNDLAWRQKRGYQADVEPSTDPRLTRVSQVRQTTGDETLVPVPAAGGKIRPPKRQVFPLRTTPSAKRNFFQRHPVLCLFLGALLLIPIYAGVLWGRIGLAHWGNHIKYGDHAPRDVIAADFPGGISTTIYATNVSTKEGQQLQVVILPEGNKATVLTLRLLASEWGDTTQVVPTLTQNGTGGAQLILTGDPKAERWTCPIQETFNIVLLPGLGFHIDQV